MATYNVIIETNHNEIKIIAKIKTKDNGAAMLYWHGGENDYGMWHRNLNEALSKIRMMADYPDAYLQPCKSET